MHKSHYFNSAVEIILETVSKPHSSAKDVLCILETNYRALKELLGKSTGKSCKVEAAVALWKGSCHLVEFMAHFAYQCYIEGSRGVCTK